MKNTFVIRDLTFAYPEQGENALDHIDLQIRQGEFLVLCGPSGCGKSTLLRQLKPALAPHGTRSGSILFEGTPLEDVDLRTQSRRIGFVRQDPDNQLVTDKVWHELAFGPESLGLDPAVIRRRVAEMASFFGIQTWFYQDVAALSGGQKQLLNLAAVMVTQPDVLILDEPTGQLDPIAAGEFLSMLGKLNRELGTTVILAEHRLDDALPYADRVAVMDRGRLLHAGAPAQVGTALKADGHPMFLAMPAAMRIWAATDSRADCPVTVRDGRDWLTAFAAEHPLGPLPEPTGYTGTGETVLTGVDLWFRYEQNGPDVLKGLSLAVKRGELFALLGGNGTGKTTGLKLLSGLLKPQRGTVRRQGRVGVLPQDPRALFLHKTVREELPESLGQDRDDLIRLCRLEPLLDRHPYDLSGGEQQRAALAKVLLQGPDILFLDEPTKGLDAAYQQTLGEILLGLTRRGVTVVMVSHDVEFCARYAHRCALFFDGSIVTQAPPRAFFSGNRFYTTAANRMARELLPEAVTPEDVMTACGGTVPQTPILPGDTSPPPPREPAPEREPPSRTAKRRKLPKRTLVAMALTLLLIPLTLFGGQAWLSGRKYYFISLLVLLEAMLPFFLLFEGRKPQARELVLIAVLCALNVAGRAAFFMLPECKPVIAMTVIAGVAFGGETGFLVGALTMLVSNMLFSQGPWTPWQMFSLGLIGFLAGVLYRKGRLRRSRISLCAFGAISAIVVYGGIMNPATALLWAEDVTWPLLMTYWASGFPLDCVQAAATWLFLWFAGMPLLEKLDRVKVKYGLCSPGEGFLDKPAEYDYNEQQQTRRDRIQKRGTL